GKGCVGAVLLTIIIIVAGVVIGPEEAQMRRANSAEVAAYVGLSEDAEYPAKVGGFVYEQRGPSAEFYFGTGEVNSSKPVRILPIAVAFDGVTYVDLPSLASSDV